MAAKVLIGLVAVLFWVTVIYLTCTGTMPDTVLLGIVFVGFWLVVICLYWIGGECPKCNRPRAVRRTGRKSSSDHYTREFRCRYCNHRWWQDTFVP